MNRILLSITEDWNYARYIVENYLDGYGKNEIFIGIEDCLEQLNLTKEKKYVIYGAGMFGAQAYRYLKNQNIKVMAFCDTNISKQKEDYCGLSVLSPDEIVKNNSLQILLAVWEQSENIKEFLLGKGISEDRIIDCFTVKSYTDKSQYFDQDIIHWTNDEVFVDCGCYDFETPEIFVKKCPNYHKVYCFEPDHTNYINIVDKVTKESFHNVEVLPYGVWNTNETLCFGGNGSSAKIDEMGKESIDVVSIDETIHDSVTFIKMDIEGSELKALEGAKNIIIKNKPKLAISVYHRPEDIISIPLYIESLVSGYKLYLRHYSNYFATETVLYAIHEGNK